MFLLISLPCLVFAGNDSIPRETILTRLRESERRYWDSLKGKQISYTVTVTSPNFKGKKHAKYDFYCSKRGFVCLKAEKTWDGKRWTTWHIANDKYTAEVTQDASNKRYLLARLDQKAPTPIQSLDPLDHSGILGPITFAEYYISEMFSDPVYQFIDARTLEKGVMEIRFARSKFTSDSVILREHPGGYLTVTKWFSTTIIDGNKAVEFRRSTMVYALEDHQKIGHISGYTSENIAPRTGQITRTEVGSDFVVDHSELDESQFFLRGYGLTEPAGGPGSDKSNVLHWAVYGIAAVVLLYIRVKLRTKSVGK